MKELSVLLDFAGYIALLLWGVHMVQSGVQRAFGAALGVWLGKALGRRIRAFFAGLAITSLLQSSTATGLMITGFAAGGLVALVPGLAAMLGANVGTTLIVQLLSFKFTALAPGLIFLGVWLFRSHQAGPRKDSGRVFIGLGLLLLSLHELVGLFAPLNDAPLLKTILEALASAPLTGLILAAILTWAAHSSVAIVILIMSLAGHEMLGAELTYALVLGANLGTAINPILEGTSGSDRSQKRLPLGNLGTRVVGCLIGMLLLPWIPSIMGFFTSDPARAVANFHTFFNIAIAVLFLPILQPYAKLLTRYLPRKSDPDDPSKTMYLDDSAREVPAVAIANAAREALRMSDMLQSILSLAKSALQAGGNQSLNHARYLHRAISKLEHAICEYLGVLDHEDLSVEDRQRLNDVVIFASNISHAGQICVSALLAHVSQIKRYNWNLNSDQVTELEQLMSRLIRNQRQSAALFMAEDLKTARFLAFEKDHFREMELAASERYVKSLKAGEIENVEMGSVYLELLRDIKSINSYLVGAAAYPILAKHDELLPNRLRINEEAND